MGLSQEERFHRYHRVLSRARWSSLEVSRALLDLLVEMFVAEGDPLVVGIDETLERRYGRKISAKGVYRDPVRSTHESFVKASGLRWVCAMLLVEIPWAARVWALPFLSALAPSERYAAKQGKRHKKITEWAWQLLLQIRRWYPEREIVVVADGAYASLKLLNRCRSLSRPVIFITRLRLDAALYEPAPPRRRGQIGRPRIKGERLPNLSVVAEDPTTVWKHTTIANWYGEREREVEIASQTAVWYSTGLFAVPLRWVLLRDPQGEFATQALLLCTDLEADPEKVVCWFVTRWQLEVTFQEARRHLGFETQRQWSELAIRRTTPALLGLFSLVTLFAHHHMMRRAADAVRQVAWYRKRHPTFADALALVRKELWASATFHGSPAQSETVKVPRAYLERLTDAVCYAA